MVLSMERWKGKVAIVTGASSGIGAAIVEQLVANGLVVVGLARRVDKIQELADKLKRLPGKLHPIKTDLTKDQDILDAFKTVSVKLGPVHILINNAGMALHESLLINGDSADWRKLFDLNVIGLSVATREAVKVMTEHKIPGHIIHINSVLGHVVPNLSGLNVYPASKYAVTALADTLRFELQSVQSKIKVTNLSPGLVESEMTSLGENVGELRKAYYEKNTSLKAEEIADGVIYALSTGENVLVKELTIKPLGELI